MSKSDKPALNRRTAMVGAGAAGALATAAALLPGRGQAPDGTTSAEAKPEPGPKGYRLTEHIKQYYAKARI